MRGLLVGMFALLALVAGAATAALAEPVDVRSEGAPPKMLGDAIVRTLDDDELAQLRGSCSKWGYETDGPCTTSGCRWITNSYWNIIDVHMNLKCKSQATGSDNCATCQVSGCCRKIYCDSDSSCSAANCDDYSLPCSTPQIGVILWDNEPPPPCYIARWPERQAAS